MALRAADWQKLPTTLTELCINTTLRCGQSFRYVLLPPPGGIVHHLNSVQMAQIR